MLTLCTSLHTSLAQYWKCATDTTCLIDHLIGTPLAFSSKEYYQKAWSKFSECPTLQRPDLRFIQGSITNLDCAAKVATITEHETRTERQESYDYFVAASGLRRAWPTVPQALNKEDFLKEATTAIEAAEKAREGVVVIGGGMFSSWIRASSPG